MSKFINYNIRKLIQDITSFKDKKKIVYLKLAKNLNI